MRFLQFIKWWWKSNDYFNRTIACFAIFCVIPLAIASIFFGKIALVAIVIAALMIIAGWALFGIFYWFRTQWLEFIDDEPTEDTEVMRRLQGIPTPSRKKRTVREE